MFEGIRQACEAGEGSPVRSWGSAKAREEKEGAGILPSTSTEAKVMDVLVTDTSILTPC